MEIKRISISINSQVKIQLERLAKSNYRTLNGEINKALGWYILSQADVVERQKETFTTPIHIIETAMPHQTEAIEPTIHQFTSIITNMMK